MAAQYDISLVESSPFNSLLNFRDVGRTINQLQDKVQVFFPPAAEAYMNSSVLRDGIFYRSARVIQQRIDMRFGLLTRKA